MIEIASTEPTAVNDGPVLSPEPVPEGSALYASLHGTPDVESSDSPQGNPQPEMPLEVARWSDQCAQWVRARPLTAVIGAFGLGLILGRRRR